MKRIEIKMKIFTRPSQPIHDLPCSIIVRRKYLLVLENNTYSYFNFLKKFNANNFFFL